MRETENLNLLHLSPHPQNPKNLRKNSENVSDKPARSVSN